MKLYSYLLLAIASLGTLTDCQSDQTSKNAPTDFKVGPPSQYTQEYHSIVFKGSINILSDNLSQGINSLIGRLRSEAMMCQIKEDTLFIVNEESLMKRIRCAIPEYMNLVIYDRVQLEYANQISSRFDVKLFDSSKLLIDRVKGGSLSIEAHNEANVEIASSYSPRINIVLQDRAGLNAEHVLVDTAYLMTNSKGNISLNCQNYLEAKGEGTGTIRFIGNPKISNQLKFPKILSSF